MKPERAVAILKRCRDDLDYWPDDDEDTPIWDYAIAAIRERERLINALEGLERNDPSALKRLAGEEP